jgi:hypothetical protein
VPGRLLLSTRFSCDGQCLHDLKQAAQPIFNCLLCEPFLAAYGGTHVYQAVCLGNVFGFLSMVG